MNLCHVVPSLAEQHGGPSRSVRALCTALADEGHHVDLLTTTTAAPSDDVRADGRLRISSLKRDWPRRICRSIELRRALADTDASIVHHHSLWLRTLHYAHRHSRRTRTPLVIAPRGMTSAWAWSHHGWRKRFAGTFVHPGALAAVAGWHATSRQEADEIRALGFSQPICIAPNGVSAPTDEERERARKHWHEACPVSATRPVALFYSRLHPKKRVLELIDLWIEQRLGDWLLLIVGIPEDYTPEMLDRYVVRAGGAGRVAIFNGLDQPPPYPVASLFVLPSHNENFGLVIAEAMAHGVPVVVTDTTPWQALNRSDLGWCVPWEEFGARLRLAVADSELSLRGQKARDWVLREFSWSRSATELSQFYATLLAGT